MTRGPRTTTAYSSGEPGWCLPTPSLVLLTACPQLRQLLIELRLDDVAATGLRRRAFPIDALFFDKTTGANWAVPAHQDLIVPVPRDVSVPLVRNLGTLHGVAYGEPPLRALEQLDAELRQTSSDSFRPYDCRAGELLLMKPLIVHRSARAMRPARRRVLHVANCKSRTALSCFFLVRPYCDLMCAELDAQTTAESTTGLKPDGRSGFRRHVGSRRVGGRRQARGVLRSD